MPQRVWNGVAWVPIRNQWVWNGVSWVEAKSQKAWNGVAWGYVWVPLTGASVTGPAWVMSSSAGANAASPNVIQPATFTVTLSKPASVRRLSLQMSHQGGVWTEYAAWDAPSAATLTHVQGFTTTGSWQVRVVATDLDGEVVTSAAHAITCYTKQLSTGVNIPNPTDGQVVQLGASCSGGDCGLMYASAGWWYRWAGGGWTFFGGGNPLDWQSGNPGTFIDWLWQESFSDGSVLNSASVRVTIGSAAPPQTEVVLVGPAGGAAAQAALDEGFDKGLPVRFVGGFDNGGAYRVRIPANARVDATQASFTRMQFLNGAAVGAAGPANDRYRGVVAPDGGYRRAGNIVWVGGSFDCFDVVSTAFSISHCPSFEVRGATVWNYGSPGHGIEINSSGGPMVGGGVTNLADSQFTIRVIDCVWNGVISRRASDYDEAVHIDYAWANEDMATAAGVVNDGTVCNNVLARGNTFQKGPNSLYSPPVGFGTHHAVTDSAGGRALPVAQHGNIRVHANTFIGVVPVDIAGNERAAVHIRNSMKQVWIVGNAFYSCAAAVSLGLVDVDAAGFPAADGVWITGNHFQSCVAANQRWVDTNSPDTGANDRWSGVHIDDNTFTGAIPGSQTTYLIGCSNVAGLSVQSNRFWGLSGGGALSSQTGNRIHGTPSAPAAGTSGMTLAGNTWSASASGSGAVEANS